MTGAEGMPHDAPSALELVESVREWLQSDVLAETTGRINFHARVAINVLAMVEREMTLGPGQAVDHRARLKMLGFTDDAELAAAIRSGDLDPDQTVRNVIWDSVRDKLAVANPTYLNDDRR